VPRLWNDIDGEVREALGEGSDQLVALDLRDQGPRGRSVIWSKVMCSHGSSTGLSGKSVSA
jgi:hypothetical protein